MIRITLKSALLSALFLFCSVALAEDAILKPFVLASKGEGTLADKSAQVKTALVAAGFTVAGEYAPYAGANIIIVTSDELKKNAAASEFGDYGAVQLAGVGEGSCASKNAPGSNVITFMNRPVS